MTVDVQDQNVTRMEEKFRSVFELSLSNFLDRQVQISQTKPQAFEFKSFKGAMPGEVVLASLTATEGLPGKLHYVITKEHAAIVADLLLMGDGTAAFSHNEHLETLRDFFREVTASFAAEFGKDIGHQFAFEDIKIALVDLTLTDFVGTGWMVSRFEIELTSPATVYQLISKDFILACYPDRNTVPDYEENDDLGSEGLQNLQKEMGLVFDIELPVSIELGRTSMMIRDIVKLTTGAIVELDKLSGEPVDLYVNNKRFARGEVVVVDENFAVRITELINPDERLIASRN